MKFKVKKPIGGFENINEVYLEKKDDDFALLKDENGNELFILINPFSLKKEYSFDVPADVKALLDLNENSKIYVYLNVIKKKPTDESLINFKAPFIFNLDNNTCAQVIIDEEEIYPLKEFIDLK